MRQVASRFFKERAGNFGVMLGLIMLPTTLAVGVATDYGYALSVRNQLQSAADTAAVSALAEQSVGVIAGLSKSIIGDVAEGNKDAEALFKSNLDGKIAAYLSTYNASVKRDASQFTSEVRFSADVPTSLMGIVGIRTVTVAGVAKASFVPATYIDFYLMLDNSPSMGLGATLDDIAKLEKANKCALACHTTKNLSQNTYAKVESLGANTRLQVVRKAAQAMMTTAVDTRKYADQYRMAVYYMGDSEANIGLTNAAKLSSDLTSVANGTAKIELMSVPEHSFPNQQTDLLGNLTSLKPLIGAGGSGLNASDRQKVLFLVSDGVEDTPRSACLKPKASGSRCQQPIDYSICEKIKGEGVRIAVLYTTYYPIPSDGWYNKWIKPFQGEIATNMKACASNDLYFEVSPSQGIEEAMNALFLKVVNMPKLTQ